MMNHNYRLVWSETGQCQVSAPENAQGRGVRVVWKGGRRVRVATLATTGAGRGRIRNLRDASRRLLCFALAASLAFPPSVFALPTGGQVVAGSVATTVSGTQMTLNQTSRAAVMNWQQFNIAANESLRIRQSGADAALLARVTGGNPSELLGRLQADGKLFLINPKGILVGAGAVIDTASFLASTLDVADADFLKGGALTFTGDAGAGIVNLGKITAREGNVLLFAHSVQNAGEIAAPKGTAGLGAGSEIFLASPDDATFTVKLNLPANAKKAGAEITAVDNTGTIAAAQAELKAAGGSIYDLAVNQRGLVRASGVEQRPDGRVILTADGGTVSVTGSVSARKADGSGGEILVGGDFQGKNPAVANAIRTYVGPAATLDASAAAPTGDGGKVVVWADSDTRYYGSIEARAGAQGGNGGNAEVSGKGKLAFNGSADLRAPNGARGTLLLDPTDIDIVAGAAGANPGGLVTVGANSTWPFAADAGAQTINNGTVNTLLGTGNLELQASNSLTVSAAVSSNAANTLTLNSPTIAANAGISLTNGTVLFKSTNSAAVSINSASGATIAASQVTITNVPEVTLSGPVSTASFRYNGLAPAFNTSFSANNASNAISALVLSNTDDLSVKFTGDVAVNSSTAMTVSALITNAGNVTISSGGNLTLRGVNGSIASSAIKSTLKTKLASTGGSFINQAGAGLLTGNERKLIYTATTGSGFTDGGLGYSQVNSVSYPNDPQGSGNVTYIQAAAPLPTLTITANDFARLYGQPDPTFTAAYSGGTSANLSTLPSFGILQGTHVNTGTYTIVPSGAASSNYTLSYVNGQLTINPATLTYVADSFSRIYGAANPAFSGSVTGFVLGDTLASATTGTATFTSAATSSSNVNSYAVNGSGLTATTSNYVFAQAAGNATALSVRLPSFTIAADDFTMLYGQPDPTFTATYSGGTSTDLSTPPSFSILQGTHVNAGTYTIVPSGAASSNKDISYVNGKLTINPATLTYVSDPFSRPYGATNPAYSGSVTGFVLGDTLANATTGTLAFGSTATTTSKVGSYAITGSGLTATTGNYVLAQAAGNAAALTVNPATLTYTANAASRIYGAANPVFAGSVSGFVLSDTLASATTGTLAFGATATTAGNVGGYAITGSGLTANNGNYVFAQAPGNSAAFSITPATLTYVSGPFSRTYGAANPAFSGSVSGFVAGDNLNKSTSGTVTFGTTATTASNVGGYAINGAGLSANHGNYVFAQAAANGAAFTINPATLTYVSDPFSRAYGAANPAFSGSVSGFVAGDNLNKSTSGTLAFGSAATATSNVGGYTINGSGLSANNGNYVFAQAAGNSAALTINPATLTVAADAASRPYGAANPAFSAQYSGFVNGDTAAIISGLQLGTNASTAAPVGTYQVFPAVAASAPNYAISYVFGTLTVTPAPLTITAPDASRHYGDPNVFSGAVQYAGLVNGDTVESIYLPTLNSLSPQVQLSSPATAGSPVGSYAITPSGFNLRPPYNYSIAYAPGTLSVTRIPYTIVAPDLTALIGAVPASVAVNTPALPSFGPQFTVYARSEKESTGNIWNDLNAPSYVLRPFIVPAANTTLGDIYAHYDIQLVPGHLKATPPPVDPVTLKQGTTVNGVTTVKVVPVSFEVPMIFEDPKTTESDTTIITLDNSTTKTSMTDKELKAAMDVKESKVVVKYATMDKYTLGTVVKELGPDMLLPAVRGLLANPDGIKDMPADQRKILEDYRDRKITSAQLAAMMASDPTALAAMMPAVGKAMMEVMASGMPLSAAQQVFAGHIAENINKQRAILAQELDKQRLQYEIDKSKAVNNAYTMKTMPDIAISAQQAATERAIAAAIGAGVGLSLGGGAVALLSVPAVATAIFPVVVGSVSSGLGLFTGAMAAAGAATGVGIAVVAVVIVAVVAAAVLSQEQKNISAFDAAVERANTRVDTKVVSKLSGMDLKNDDIAKSEFLGAFVATMLQIN